MVRPLLEITTTPARYEYEVMRARLQMSQEKPRVQRTVKRASLNMQRQAGRFEMNTVRRRSDMGFKGVVDRAEYEGDRGQQTAGDATARYAQVGNQLAQIDKGANVPDTLWGQSMHHNKGDLVLVPLSPVELNYVPASLAMDFQPGQMHSNWDVGRARLDFVPGSFSMNVVQYASINIEYTGGPLYVPPSADPNFVAEA